MVLWKNCFLYLFLTVFELCVGDNPFIKPTENKLSGSQSRKIRDKKLLDLKKNTSNISSYLKNDAGILSTESGSNSEAQHVAEFPSTSSSTEPIVRKYSISDNSDKKNFFDEESGLTEVKPEPVDFNDPTSWRITKSNIKIPCPLDYYSERDYKEHEIEKEKNPDEGGEQQSGLSINDIMPEDPNNYDKMRPPKKNGNPTTVYFHVTVMGLDSIDEGSMTYAADIFFAQTWKDYRLRLPENMTTEYRLLEVDWLKNMWRPDSYFKNAKSVTFQTMTIPNHYMWLYRDKTILYMVKLTLRLSCAMNFMIYPHDTQECKLQMESLSHTTADMVFQWDPDVPLVVDKNIELPQLALVENHTADCTQVYSTGNFTCLEVVFQLKRRLGYYLFHTYIPTCLIVIMSWVSFWIKPEAAPARVTLGVTSLLTLSTQHAKSQAALPPVSYLKAVDAFMSVCTIFVFMALMEYCLVNIVLGDSDLPKPPQPTLKIDSVLEGPTTRENSFLLSGKPKIAPTISPAQRARNQAIYIDRFSRVFFPLLFAVLNGTYWIMFAEYI